ncbi:MAG TPA: MFS transporter, partial [Burkholderiales bacterium]
LYTLAFGNFVIGTGTMITAGLLNLIAADLGVSLAAVGQLLTAYAVATCVGAPILAGVTSRISRRALLVGALVLFALCHVGAAFAPSYAVLLLLRLLTGSGAAIYTPQAAATAGLLVDPAQRGRAVALVFLGFSLSSVVGNPLSIYLGAALGWRAAFVVVGLVAALCAALVYVQVPKGLYVPRIDAAAWRAVFGNRALLLVLATTVLQAAAQFVLLTYLAAVLKNDLGASPTLIGALFAWIGASGVAGNLIAGALIDRLGAARVVAATIATILAAFLLWPLTRGSLPMTLLALTLWGLGAFAIQGAQQVRLIAMAPPLASASVALNSSSFYLGQAAGAGLGGLVLVHFDLGALSWIGAGLLLLTWAVSTAAQARSERLDPAGAVDPLRR